MKKFLRSLIAPVACAALVSACVDAGPADPNEPVNENQTANTWVFNNGEEVKTGSALIFGISGHVTVLFSAETGLATANDIRNAGDCTEIKFPISAIGSEIDLTALSDSDASACFVSGLPEFGKTNGFKIDGKLKTVKEGKLSSSLENEEMSIRCEFTTLGKNTKFSVYLRCPYKEIVIPVPDGNYYEYDGKVVEFKSVHAFNIEDAGKKYIGFYAAPEEGLELDDIMMSEHRLGFMIDEAGLTDGSVLDTESGRPVFDVKNLPDGCELQMTLVNSTENLRISVPGNSVTEGILTVYLTETAGSRTLYAAGNISLSDGKVLKMSCVSPFATEKPDKDSYGKIEYSVKSRNISESASFKCGFHHRNTWDSGIAVTYSVSNVHNYIQLGSNTFVEIYAGSEQLLNGKPFDVARTSHPFSFMIEYLDLGKETTVPVKIDNNNRAGASGTISFKKNENGLYDATFDLELDYGDITISGTYTGETQPRNIIYTNKEGKIDEVRSATLDVTGDPCILYMSAKNGTAGPDQYDIKCEVPANEWRYGIYMAFSGQNSAVTWIDGFRYDRSTSDTSPIFGGNWRVLDPVAIKDGYASECRTTLYGNNSCFAYYYGEIKLID